MPCPNFLERPEIGLLFLRHEVRNAIFVNPEESVEFPGDGGIVRNEPTHEAGSDETGENAEESADGQDNTTRAAHRTAEQIETDAKQDGDEAGVNHR